MTSISKFDSKIAEKLYAELPDEQIGSVDELGWYGLYRNAYGYSVIVLSEDSQGFVYSYMNIDAEEYWQALVNEYEEFDNERLEFDANVRLANS